ncbi:hypothetical protein GCM10025883_02060 [Mobilicoccus caccae]|uniref:Uncharacterized protein n=1 Tax=Mobilicoccus caccae TaxID=1859295 RepID=A0ABQ6IM29_9MICO|nr:hypothetical protein GCM10025883_02060 [Mobilicoccus caccae]
MIGAGRLGVVLGEPVATTLLLDLARRALGHERVLLVVGPERHDPHVAAISGATGVEIARDATEFTSVAYVDTAEGDLDVVRTVGAHRVIRPFAEAGWTHADVLGCADALLLDIPTRPDAQGADTAATAATGPVRLAAAGEGLPT